MELFNQFNKIEKKCYVESDEITKNISLKFDYDFKGETRFSGFNKPDVPENFNIGLIVGPSGSGKSTILKMFGEIKDNIWKENKAIVSHFNTADEAIEKLSSVGLNSIPDWFKPFNVLSNGEKFRVNLAMSLRDNAVIDEFTSVVDRTVAKSACFSFQKYIRKKNIRNIVLASCHYDIIEWLNPDWYFDMIKGEIHLPRGLLCRPRINLRLHELKNVDEVKRMWSVFKKYHYLTSDINLCCRAWILYLEDYLVAFNSALPQPGIKDRKNLWREHRLVVLPDFQGLGIGAVFSENVGEILLSQKKLFLSKTTHPRLGEYRNKSDNWIASSSNLSISGEHGGLMKNTKIRKVKCFSHYYKKDKN